MGTWGRYLFDNDLSMDIRDYYYDQLKNGVTNEEAQARTIKEFVEVIESDEAPLFWVSLAYYQWEVGRLSSHVMQQALFYCRHDDQLFWGEFEESFGKNDLYLLLNKVSDILTSPMPEEKKFRKQAVVTTNPWNVGDCYAYLLHSDKSKKSGFFEKYVVFHKIGETVLCEKVYSVLEIFNSVFDRLPSLSDIQNAPVLPLISPPGVDGGPVSIDDYVPSFDSYLRACFLISKKSEYPKSYLTYIGNIISSKSRLSEREVSFLHWYKDDMEEWLLDFISEWESIDY